MDIKPCTCGELPDLESSTYGWEAEERTSYYYRCPACGQRVGVWESKQEALQEWNKAHLLTTQAIHGSIDIGSTDEGKSLLLPFVE